MNASYPKSLSRSAPRSPEYTVHTVRTLPLMTSLNTCAGASKQTLSVSPVQPLRSESSNPSKGGRIRPAGAVAAPHKQFARRMPSLCALLTDNFEIGRDVLASKQIELRSSQVRWVFFAREQRRQNKPIYCVVKTERFAGENHRRGSARPRAGCVSTAVRLSGRNQFQRCPHFQDTKCLTVDLLAGGMVLPEQGGPFGAGILDCLSGGMSN